jgi:hypothetical protein
VRIFTFFFFRKVFPIFLASSNEFTGVRGSKIFSLGSDVHYFAHGRCGPFVLDGPIVLGHESSGIVEEIGEGVTHVKRTKIIAFS